MANANASRVGVFRQAADSILGVIFSPPVEAVELRSRKTTDCPHPINALSVDDVGDAYCGDCGEDMM